MSSYWSLGALKLVYWISKVICEIIEIKDLELEMKKEMANLQYSCLERIMNRGELER